MKTPVPSKVYHFLRETSNIDFYTVPEEQTDLRYQTPLESSKYLLKLGGGQNQKA